MQSRTKFSLVIFSHRVMRLSVILTAMIVIAHAQSTGPDYSNVKDFAGSTHLLRDDDLVLTFTYQNPSSEFRQVMFSAGSINSSANVSSFNAYSVIPQGQAGCNTAGGCYLDYQYYDFLNTATGRFFNTDRDTTVLYPFQLTVRIIPFSSPHGRPELRQWRLSVDDNRPGREFCDRWKPFHLLRGGLQRRRIR